MNSIAKVSAAGALALGFGVAHATINYPESNPDVLLFAEVLNSSSAVIGSYAGDSGVAFTSTIPNGTVGSLSTGTDSNLSKLLALATGSDTIEWAVLGGKVTASGNFTSTDQFLTTIGGSGSVAQLALRSGTNTTHWSSGLEETLTAVDTNLSSKAATSVFANTIATGGIWDASQSLGNTNLVNWFGQGTDTAQTGLGSTTLYKVTEGAGTTSPVQVAGLGTVTLSSTGLSFTAGTGGGGGTTVPLPAAVWLLGSGLLGLAGVGRRKLTAT